MGEARRQGRAPAQIRRLEPGVTLSFLGRR